MADTDKYTVGWISDIRLEYVAAQAFLDEEHDLVDSLDMASNLEFTCGKMGNHNVVIACIPSGELGVAGSAVTATNLKNRFRNIKFILMVGIAGGAPSHLHDIRLGDVVVGSRASNAQEGGVFQYDKGRGVQNEEFYITAHTKEPPAFLQLAVDRLIDRYSQRKYRLREHVEEVLTRFPELRRAYEKPLERDLLFMSDYTHGSYLENSHCSHDCDTSDFNLIHRQRRNEDAGDPVIHHGVIASASSVLKDALRRDRLAHERGVLCFDVGSAGVISPCLVIRGICNYSYSHPSRIWNGYAVMTATAYAKDLLSCVPQQRIGPGHSDAKLQRTSGVASTDTLRELHRDSPIELQRRKYPAEVYELDASPLHPSVLPSGQDIYRSSSASSENSSVRKAIYKVLDVAETSQWKSPLGDTLPSANVSPAAVEVAYAKPKPQTEVFYSLRVFAFHQTTLVLIFAVSFMLSGAMIAMALSQVREPVCNPQPHKLRTDDNFWTLLGQFFLQMLSIYCTVYVVVQNHEVKANAANFWFWSSLVVSFATNIAAVCIYGWSWQFSNMLCFASGFMQLIPVGQLAVSLGSDSRRMEMQNGLASKLEEGYTD